MLVIKQLMVPIDLHGISYINRLINGNNSADLQQVSTCILMK